MIIKKIVTKTITADDPASSILSKSELGEVQSDEAVGYYFHGNHGSDVFLTDGPSADEIYKVEAGASGLLSAFDPNSDMKYLKASSSTDVDVTAFRLDRISSGNVNDPATGLVDIDTIDADIGMEGEHLASLPNLNDGDVEDAQMDDRGRLYTIIHQAFASVGLDSILTEEQNVIETVQRLVADGTYAPQKFIAENATYDELVTTSQGVLKQAYMLLDDQTVESKTYYFHVYDGAIGNEKVLPPIPVNMSQGDAGLAPFDASEDQVSFNNGLRLAVSTTFDSYTAPVDSEKVSFYALYQD
jgi:hypothetical protein